MLDSKRIYLGCQVTAAEPGFSFGVVADAGFILISRYRDQGADPELILYQKRDPETAMRENPKENLSGAD